MSLSIGQIAELVHTVNRAYCRSIGDLSQPAWENAPDWMKASTVNGVLFAQENPDASPSDIHCNWLREKIADGWVYGPVKNSESKRHPCCVPYADLPKEQRVKDHLFRAVVHKLLEMNDE